MLKAVSSITNAIGALNFKGTWDANANSPALASSVGTKGDYYVVGTAGTTNLNGISNWGVGDLATFNGSVWQRVEGGADLNGVNLSVSGTSTLSALTASTALALNASKEIVSITNTGTGNNVLATAPTLVGDLTLSTGNLVIGTSGKGIDFSATPGTGTSELLSDYEEGNWTPVLRGATTAGTYEFVNNTCQYTKVGRVVTLTAFLRLAGSITGGGVGYAQITGLPFEKLNNSWTVGPVSFIGVVFTGVPTIAPITSGNTSTLYFPQLITAGGSEVDISGFGVGDYLNFTITYITA